MGIGKGFIQASGNQGIHYVFSRAKSRRGPIHRHSCISWHGDCCDLSRRRVVRAGQSPATQSRFRKEPSMKTCWKLLAGSGPPPVAAMLSFSAAAAATTTVVITSPAAGLTTPNDLGV